MPAAREQSSYARGFTNLTLGKNEEEGVGGQFGHASSNHWTNSLFTIQGYSQVLVYNIICHRNS